MQKIVLTILLALSLEAKMIDGVAVVVKGKAITLLDIKKEMKLSKVDETAATDALIRKTLELQEVDERKITVSSSEVYDDIKKSAARNGLNVSEFYEAIRESNGLTSLELKEKVKEKLLSQKLYSSIAYSVVDEPSDDEIESYYKLHKESFIHPSGFNVVIYNAKSKQRLQEKIDNPMFHSPDITSTEQNLPYDRIAPELAQLLEKTPLNSFTPIVPNGKGAYASFYIKEIEPPKEANIESVKNKVINMMMAEQREQVLGNYFARLRHNADIKMIRNVE
ncbi:SurA domain-containing protein [Sulfurimonas hongkongensis]|uniref:SurA domain-containing protein n=1 Tax=Sulfurimonas hongkongensis TaxID=1172190 RepID=T0KQD8_9BACT|nr:peptidylprolyl isomerase [Sulfurimonas hongkongensis]EQB39144.1 SurA domain-containing protein [Sulfurimonas hongkongensis]